MVSLLNHSSEKSTKLVLGFLDQNVREDYLKFIQVSDQYNKDALLIISNKSHNMEKSLIDIVKTINEITVSMNQ